MAIVLLAGCSDGAAVPVDMMPGFRETVLPTTEGGRPSPRAVHVGPDGDRYVLDTLGQVLAFRPDGSLRGRWWMPDYSVGRPEGICVTTGGDVYVADTHYHRVVQFDAAGNVVRTFGTRGEEPGQFEYPVAVELDDAEDFLYVAEYGGHDRVQKFTLDGEYVSEFGEVGTGPGQFQRASGLVFRRGSDGVGRVFVSDAINQQVHVFTEDGVFERLLGEGPQLGFPYDIAGGPGGVLAAANYSTGTVTLFDEDGSLRGVYGGAGRDAGQLWTPWGVAVAGDGTVIVADTGNRRLVEFRP